MLAARGCRLILAGRNLAELEKTAADLRIRHAAEADVVPFDALDFAGHEAFFARVLTCAAGSLDGVVAAYGYLPDQRRSETDPEETRRAIDVNFTSVVSLLNLAANHLQQRGAGYIAAITSVAADRGRQSNYTYGAAKAGLNVYLQGLRNRLARSGVCVLSIKPGFVDTPMTQGIVNPNSPLMATPERVARDIDRAIRRRRRTLYTPWFWRPIMAVIRAIPEPIFMRMKL